MSYWFRKIESGGTASTWINQLIEPTINVIIKLHQFSDNLYGTDFTELKNYLAACNVYEEPSQAKLQIVPRFAWCE